MRYTICRTSTYWDKPHPDAYEVEFERWDCRTCKTEAEFDKQLAKYDGAWRAKGTAWKKWDGGIARLDGTQRLWCIDVDDLKKFVNENGPIVVSPRSYSLNGVDGDVPLDIEIYDEYWE